MYPAHATPQVGMGAPDILIPMGTIGAKELTFRTSFRYGVSFAFCPAYAELTAQQPGDYALAIALAGSGKLDVKPMVTHR